MCMLPWIIKKPHSYVFLTESWKFFWHSSAQNYFMTSISSFMELCLIVVAEVNLLHCHHWSVGGKKKSQVPGLHIQSLNKNCWVKTCIFNKLPRLFLGTSKFEMLHSYEKWMSAPFTRQCMASFYYLSFHKWMKYSVYCTIGFLMIVL